MREVKLSTGKTIVVRPLTGKDVREIDALPKATDWSLLWETLRRAGFSQEQLDELPFPDVLAINRGVSAETYGLREEEKN